MDFKNNKTNIDDFQDQQQNKHRPRSNLRTMFKNGKAEFNSPMWVTLRPVTIFLISLLLVVSICAFGYFSVLNKYINPIDKKDATALLVEIPTRSSTTAIASILYGESDSPKLIRSKAYFKIYVDFMGKSGMLRSGTYELAKNMRIPDIVNKITSGESVGEQVIQFRIIEGMKIEDIANSLVSNDVITSKDRFLELCNTKDFTKNIDVAANSSNGARKYALEGYLFPDTYKVYKSSTEEIVINKMITKLNTTITAEYYDRATELGMSMDQIMTLASIIEKEAKLDDFAKVSAVFHNRLKENMPLQSCPTVQYVLGVKHYVLNKTELATDSPYNTYKFAGLPPGPICNPGKAAIEAALYPDPAFVFEQYMYFCLKEPESGQLDFAKTLQEHQANVDKYYDLWIESDNKIKAN